MVSFEENLVVIAQVKREVSKKVAGKLIYLIISGSHLYGFSSKDSDVDYRGCYLMDTNIKLGLGRPREVINLKPDIELFELEKEIGLALKGNCNVLEHLNAKPIVSTHEFLKLKQLLNNAAGKDGLYKSYKGLATHNYEKFIKKGKSSPKKYLYIFRGLMAGTYVLQTGKIESNLERLNAYFKIPEVTALIKAKREGIEKGSMPKDLDTGNLEMAISRLYENIDIAYTRSKMPRKPSDKKIKEINSFVIQMRKDFLGDD